MKMRMKRLGPNVLVALAAVFALNSAQGDPVQIATYDVEQVPQSGCGGWSYSYIGGTVIDTGRRMCCQPSGPPPGCSLAAAVPVLNFSGGTGTLGDGIVGTSIDNTELFFIRDDFVGQPITPAVTIHLAGTFYVNAIRLYGGDFINLFPGALNGVTIEIGGHSLALPTISAGPQYLNFLFQTDDIVDLSGTGLDRIPTNKIVLRNFTTAPFFGSALDQFSITEIAVDGDPPFAGVPGEANCHGLSVAALAQQFGDVPTAALALGLSTVKDLQSAISVFCGG